MAEERKSGYEHERGVSNPSGDRFISNVLDATIWRGGY
jgi:hypothetical protein